MYIFVHFEPKFINAQGLSCFEMICIVKSAIQMNVNWISEDMRLWFDMMNYELLSLLSTASFSINVLYAPFHYLQSLGLDNCSVLKPHELSTFKGITYTHLAASKGKQIPIYFFILTNIKHYTIQLKVESPGRYLCGMLEYQDAMQIVHISAHCVFKTRNCNQYSE